MYGILQRNVDEILVVREKVVTLQRVSPPRPAPRELRQVLIEATVVGCSGAMKIAYPFFIANTQCPDR